MPDKASFPKRAGQYLTNLALMSVIGTARLLPYASRVRFIGWLTFAFWVTDTCPLHLSFHFCWGVGA